MELTVPARLRRAAERWPEATALVVRGPAGSLRVGFAELARRVAEKRRELMHVRLVQSPPIHSTQEEMEPAYV